MIKTGIYIRVSTEDQAKDGFSIHAQKEKLTKYAEANEWDIIDFYIDDDILTITGCIKDEEVEQVRATIEQLEASKTILGYKALVDWDKTDREFVDALIELRVAPQRDRGFERVAQKIYNFPEVKNMYLMSGAYDLCLIIEGKTMKQVALFVAEKLAPIEGVISTSTHFVLRKYKDKGVVFGHENEENVEERGNML